MPLTTLRVHDIENRYESLTLALQAIARWAGLEVRYRSVNAALGLPFAITASDDESCLGWWMVQARDTMLPPAADLFGMRVRALHPPEAAHGLQDAAEYRQHFDASYQPLVQRALDNVQPVLAWQGWSGYRAPLWGVITATSPEGVGFVGTTMWSGGRTVVLEAPPVQLYVVEEISPRQPTDDELLGFALARAREATHGNPANAYGVRFGAQAYDTWCRRLGLDQVCATCGERSAGCHRQMARFVSSARESAIAFLHHYQDGGRPQWQTCLDALIANCKGVIAALATARDESAVEALIRSEEGRGALTAGVRAARAFDCEVARGIERLGDVVGAPI